MLLECTIEQLDVGPVTPEAAIEMGSLGYLQWLAGLPGDAGYRNEVVRAYVMAEPLSTVSPAVAVFCELLDASLKTPFAPLPLVLPPVRRRGGAVERRKRLRHHT